MEVQISNSQDIHDYEILIRKRGDNQYASYCPQLNFMLTGLEHEEVRQKMYEHIKEHITRLSESAN